MNKSFVISKDGIFWKCFFTQIAFIIFHTDMSFSDVLLQITFHWKTFLTNVTYVSHPIVNGIPMFIQYFPTFKVFLTIIAFENGYCISMSPDMILIFSSCFKFLITKGTREIGHGNIKLWVNSKYKGIYVFDVTIQRSTISIRLCPIHIKYPCWGS